MTLVVLRRSVGTVARGVRRYLPGVAPRVLDHAATISVGRVERLLERACTGLDGPSIRRVGVAHVDVEERGRRRTSARFADHDDRITDGDDGRTGLLKLSRGAEHALAELDEPRGAVDHEPRGHGGPSLGDEAAVAEGFSH